MAENLNHHPTKPVILIHRLPQYRFTLAHRLSPSFTLIDPLADSSPNPPALESSSTYAAAGAASAASLRSLLNSQGSDIAGSIRAVVAVGLTPVDAETLGCLPSVECVVVTAAGVDRVDLAECRRRGIVVAHAGDAFSDDCADFAVGLLIDVLRNVSAGDRFVKAKLWPQIGEFPIGFKLGGKRVGIVGLGSIGSRIAKRLTPLGCKVSYTSRTEKPSIPYPYHKNAVNLAAENDVLILCCSLNAQTRHIVNKEIMTALGKKGVIINIGRGALIDEPEMVRFLVEGKLGGAGLDVFENEPTVPKELFGLDNVVMSPHRAVLTPESFKALEDVVHGNLEGWFSDKRLISPVALE